jgi:hypothetical protein
MRFLDLKWTSTVMKIIIVEAKPWKPNVLLKPNREQHRNEFNLQVKLRWMHETSMIILICKEN